MLPSPDLRTPAYDGRGCIRSCGGGNNCRVVDDIVDRTGQVEFVQQMGTSGESLSDDALSPQTCLLPVGGVIGAAPHVA